MENFFEKREEYNPKEKLLYYEKEGIYLFHGSPFLVDNLEPRQSDIFNKKALKNIKHGKPCISATPFAEIAIFRSLINIKNCKGSSAFKLNKKNNPEFSTTKENLEQINEKIGYVYIFKKNDFSKFSDMEWRIDEKIKPTEVVMVTKKDLPNNIDLIDNNFNYIK